MNNELIRIEEKDGQQVVSARELYEKLGYNKTHWTRWHKKNIENNKFALENEDWTKLALRARRCDFALTIDFAKRLSMLARTEQGEKVRRYFVTCEKKLQQGTNLLNSEVVALQHAKIKELEDKVNAIEKRTETKLKHFTVMGYASLTGQFIDVRTASIIGRKSSTICKRENLKITTLPDPRFGRVNQYPISVLKRVFKNIAVF